MAQGLNIKSKRELHLFSWAFWIIIIILIAVGSWFGYRYFTTGELPGFVAVKALEADPRVDESPVSRSQIDAHVVPKSQPRYITIRDLGIEKARIFKAGVTKTGQLEAPKNLSDTVWYEKSALPGSGYGAVLIDGHNGGISRDGIFAKLRTLKSNAVITIERGDGEEFSYKVVENKSMELTEVNESGMKEMMKSIESDKEGLSIITCDGKWVPKYQQFDRRIMLRAVRV